jgi:hypothetical protein
MNVPRTARRWWRLPGRVALVLGLGALSAASARADTPGDHKQAGQGETLIRSDGGRIYLSENGRETELRLGATPQRDRLLRLLERHEPRGLRLDPEPRLIMSGGGGMGFSLWNLTKPSADKPKSANSDQWQPERRQGSPRHETTPRNRKSPSDEKG